MVTRRVTKNGKRITQYLRICSTCKTDEKWVGYLPPEGTECKICSSRKLGYAMSQRNWKEPHEKKLYKHVCIKCGSVRELKSDPVYNKTNLCGDCSRKATGKANAVHLSESTRLGKPNKVVKLKKPKIKKVVSKQAIDRARELNRLHREDYIEIGKKMAVKDTTHDADMIAKFLSNHTPSVVDACTEIPYSHSCRKQI